MNQLSDKHRQEWETSKVSPEIINRNVWTIEDPQEVDKLLNRNVDRRWKHSIDLAPGWGVAGVDPKTGERTFRGCQYKPDIPPLDPETKKPRKYFSPSKQTLSPLFLEMEDSEFWQKLLTNFTSPIVLTEGAKKAGSVLSLGIPCVSLPGVTTGGKLGRLRPELEMYCRYGRKVYLAFDRDIISKPAVRRALHNLGRMLSATGAMVYVVEWDNRHKGIDDFIAAGGDFPSRLIHALTLEEWKEQQQEEDSSEPAGEKCNLAIRYEMAKEILKDRLRWNSLKGEIELDGEPVEMEHLRLYLAVKHNVGIPSEDCYQICSYLAKRQTFSPVAEYLKQCASIYGPDEELLDSITETYLGTAEPLHKCYLRKTLIAAVARALTPGCKVDTVCILSGGQGVGKSTFWKILASEDWFDDTVGSTSDKDERLKLHQAWFIEWAELEAVFKRKDISAVKAFITTQSDQIRPPYGRSVQNFARPSIIVGSTNEAEFLADSTGNRRYWVIPVEIPDIPLDQLAAERDRIWAAAFHAFQSGERWELPAEFRQIAKADAANYQFSDPWEDVVLDYCQGLSKVAATEVLINALKMDLEKLDKRSEMRIANILKNANWTSKRERLNGRRPRIWYPPSPEVDQPESTEVGPLEEQKNAEIPNLPLEVGPGWIQGTEIGSAVSGPTSGPTPGPTPDQPPDFAKKDAEKISANLVDPTWTGLDHQLSRSTSSIDSGAIFSEGALILINGSATWIRSGSDKLPFEFVPKKLRSAPEIPINQFDSKLFWEFMQPHKVLSVSKDGQRCKVRNQETGRTSVFAVADVQVMKEAVNASSN